MSQSINLPPVPVTSLWNWNTSGAIPIVSGYPSQANGGYTPTKTGLGPADLQQFIGVPLVYYGNPSVKVPDSQIIQWLRYAEDTVEQDTSILLCQTWIASPPAFTTSQTQQQGLVVNTASGYQVRGYDYDLEDSGYDFQYSRAQDEGWMFLTLRYRPVQSTTYGLGSGAATGGLTAVKGTSFVYPLLNTYFRMPNTWNVEERDYGMIRYVPATNVMMLPLFALQLSFMGFAESVPGAINIQYTAGLTPYDLQTRYSFMSQYVLCEAALIALVSIQGTINLGADRVKMTVDGLSYETQYGRSGPFGALIEQMEKRRDTMKKLALSKVTGPVASYW